MRPAGAPVVGWPLLWAVALAPLRVLDPGFGPDGGDRGSASPSRSSLSRRPLSAQHTSDCTRVARGQSACWRRCSSQPGLWCQVSWLERAHGRTGRGSSMSGLPCTPSRSRPRSSSGRSRCCCGRTRSRIWCWSWPDLRSGSRRCVKLSDGLIAAGLIRVSCSWLAAGGRRCSWRWVGSSRRRSCSPTGARDMSTTYDGQIAPTDRPWSLDYVGAAWGDSLLFSPLLVTVLVVPCHRGGR